MGTGDIPHSKGRAANSLWVFDNNFGGQRPATREEFVAWPPPGYVPYQVVYPRWSLSYPGADFSHSSGTMRMAGESVDVVLEPLSTRYGENTLVWRPDGMGSFDSWDKPASDITYRVTLSNVRVDGPNRSFSYEVVIFDPAAPAPEKGNFMPWLFLLLDD